MHEFAGEEVGTLRLHVGVHGLDAFFFLWRGGNRGFEVIKRNSPREEPPERLPEAVEVVGKILLEHAPFS